jgi:carbonic anhydrase/acetyltransferase-like protein (isoleucine patch superfamily)
MGAILMNGVRIGEGSIVGAGSLLLEGTEIPPFSLVAGSPAKVKKTYGPEILEQIRQASAHYVSRAEHYRSNWRKLES